MGSPLGESPIKVDGVGWWFECLYTPLDTVVAGMVMS